MSEHAAIFDEGFGMFCLRFLLRAMAVLGFVLFVLRCAGIASAVEPPLRADLSAWTGESYPNALYSYSIAVFSNASTPSKVTVTFQLDKRLIVLPDHRDEPCVGVKTVVCTFSLYADHPGSGTITVRVRDGVCGLPLTSSMTVRDDRGFTMSDRTAVGLIGRCALYLPAIRSTKGARKP